MVAFLQRRSDPVRLLQRRLLIVLLLLVVAVSVRGVWGVYQKERQSRLLREEAEARLYDLERRHVDLRRDLAELTSDRGRETVLREEYDLARAGERAVVILSAAGEARQTIETEKRWWSWFPWSQ